MRECIASATWQDHLHACQIRRCCAIVKPIEIGQLLHLMNKAFFLLMVIGLCSGCSKEEPSKTQATIDWRGGSTIEKLDWKFNGKPIGHGEQGFATLLKRLDSLDDNAYLKVHYPGILWNEDIAGYDFADPFPFIDRDDLRQKFKATWSKKRFLLQQFVQ